MGWIHYVCFFIKCRNIIFEDKKMAHFMVKLSGEHDRLPLAELEAVLKSEGVECKIKASGSFHEISAESMDSSTLKRCAYVTKAYEVVATGDDIDALAGETFDNLAGVTSFRVSSNRDMQIKFGSLLTKLGMDVNLKNPEADIMVAQTRQGYSAAVSIDLARDYQKRRAQYRPYFHPTSMHPKLARACVNLLELAAGDSVLDPFCGTGGILIEAGIMGLKPFGSDIDEKMVEGARQNLREYGIEPMVSKKDALNIEGSYDGVVTDPPYGRASYASTDTSNLYCAFFKKARKLLDEGSKMVVVLPHEFRLPDGKFDVDAFFDVRMHKSLTRRVWVLTAT